MNKKIRVTSFVMSLVTIITMGGCNLKKDKEDISKSSISSVTYEDLKDDIKTTIEDNISSNILTNNDITKKKDENTKKIDSKDENLNDLINLLDKNTQKYSSSVRNKLRNLIILSYNNLEDFERVFSSVKVPNKYELIKNKLIMPLENIDDIKFLNSEKNDNYYELLERESTSCYEQKDKTIYIFEDKIIDSVDKVLLEEIIHAGQNMDNTYDFSKYLIEKEGEANFYSSIFAYGKINNTYFCSMNDEGNLDSMYLGYGLGFNCHSFASKYYAYLLALTDYETMEVYEMTGDSNPLINKISTTYKIDGNKFYDEMREVVLDLSSNICDKKVKEAINCENTFLACMNQKIDNINSKEETLEMINLFRYLNLQFGFEKFSYDSNDNVVFSTDKVINRKETINKLYNKCKEYNSFNISSDENTNKKAFNALLNARRDEENIIQFFSITDKNILLNGDNLIISNNNDSYSIDINGLVIRENTVKKNIR